MRLPRTALILAFAAAALASTQSAQAQCAPSYQCAGPSCWYALLNNPSFNDYSCNPNWVGAAIAPSSLCTDIWGRRYEAAHLNSANPSFSQHFTVPNTPGLVPFSVSLVFGTTGSPSWWDRIIIELWESGIMRESISVRTDLGPFYCHREDFYFAGNYTGKSLDIRVRASVPTVGVEYQIDSIQLFY
ncbi:MAG TPA: hypothetical protein VF789_24925 [Thermoanaerobaculia bacterium]